MALLRLSNLASECKSTPPPSMYLEGPPDHTGPATTCQFHAPVDCCITNWYKTVPKGRFHPRPRAQTCSLTISLGV